MIEKTKIRLITGILPVMTCFAAFLAAFMTCYVSADAQSLMVLAIKIIAKVAIPAGVMFFVLLLYKWGTSHAEGDGPAQKNAAGYMIAGVTLFIISVILVNVAPELAANIETTI